MSNSTDYRFSVYTGQSFSCVPTHYFAALRAVVGSVRRVSVDDIHKVSSNPSLSLLTWVKLIIPHPGIWVTTKRAIWCVDVRVDHQWCSAIEVFAWVGVDVKEELTNVVKSEVGSRIAVRNKDLEGSAVLVDSIGVGDLDAHSLGDGSQVGGGLVCPVLTRANAVEGSIGVDGSDVEWDNVHEDEVATS